MLDAAVCVFLRMKNKMMVFDSFLLAVTAGARPEPQLSKSLF